MDKIVRFLYYFNMLVVNGAGRFFCARDWSWDTAKTPWDDADLWVVLAGEGTLVAGESPFALSRGDCFVLRGGTRYRGSHDPDRPLTVYAVHFETNQGLPAFYRRMLPLDFLTNLLERAIDDFLSRKSDTSAQWLRAALLEIERFDEKNRDKEKSPVRPSIDELTQAMRTNPERRYRVDDIAASIHCTPQHLIRLFKAHTGMTPGEYLVQARIEAAKSLLRNSSHPLKRIAELLGYRDEFFFSKQFKKIVGTAPGAYRRTASGRLQ
jgi:AraC family transcriptional regulator, arabinose operon regulatory protein